MGVSVVSRLSGSSNGGLELGLDSSPMDEAVNETVIIQKH